MEKKTHQMDYNDNLISCLHIATSLQYILKKLDEKANNVLKAVLKLD